MTDQPTTNISTEWTYEEPTMSLRWSKQCVLQQAFKITRQRGPGEAFDVSIKWRDVPRED